MEKLRKFKMIKKYLQYEQIAFQNNVNNSKKPWLFLIHGLKSAAKTFDPIIPDLQNYFNVVSYDQRGHGSSEEAEFDYGLESLANDLKMLFDYLKLNEAHLLGHSFGAKTALQFCYNYPKMVLSLTIEDMHVFQSKKIKMSFDETLEMAQNEKELFPNMFDNKKDLINLLQINYNKSEIDNIIEKRTLTNYEGKIILLFKPYVATIYGYFSSVSNFTNVFKNFNKPILFILADEKDSSVSNENEKLMKKNNSSAEMKRIKGSLHNVHGSKTKQFLSCLISFYKKNKIIF